VDTAYLYERLVEEFQAMGIVFSKGVNGYSIIYNENIENIIAKLLQDFYLREGYNILLQNKNGDICISIDNNSRDISDNILFDQIGDSLDKYVSDFDYLASMSSELTFVYELFKESFNYSGNFGIGFQNVPTKMKYVIKTDIPDMIDSLEKAGFEVKDNKVIVLEENISKFYDMIERAKEDLKTKNLEQENIDFDDNTNEEENSKVDFYEKVVTTAAGLNAIVRLSIVKQDKDDSQYNRLVNISYFDKNTGVLTSDEVFGYNDGYQFDNEVLPSIIDGFSQNEVLSGKDIHVNGIDSTKCYLTTGDNENTIFLEGYNVNDVHSILDRDRENNLVGDENGRIDLNQLTEDGVIRETKMKDETFEEQVTDAQDDKDMVEENSLSNDGSKMVKKLGEVPKNNNFGFSNYISIALFLAIDVAAIFVGVFLLVN